MAALNEVFNDRPVGEANRLSAHLTEIERTDQ